MSRQQILKMLEKGTITADEAAQLLEALAGRILKLIMKDPKVLSATVRVDKPHALRFAKSVSVEMSAERKP